MTIFGLIEAIVVVCLLVYAVRHLITDVATQRIVLGLVALVVLLWLLDGAAVFGPDFHKPLFRRG